MTREIDKPTAMELLVQGRDRLRDRVDALEAELGWQRHSLSCLHVVLIAKGYPAMADGINRHIKRIDAALKGDA